MGNKIQKPVFIVGCGRSGTTMLFDLLSTHPDLMRTNGYPDGEDHDGWITHGKCVMAGIGNSRNSKYGSGINGFQYCLHMTQADVTPEIVAGMHAYYLDEVLRGNTDKRVLNKQPHLSNKLDYVLGIFPDAKIIHIIRDCEPTVASLIAVMDEHPSLMTYLPSDEAYPCLWLMQKPDEPVAISRVNRHSRFYPGGGTAMLAEYWSKVNEGVVKQMVNSKDQLLTVRYEDLIAQPQTVTEKLMTFCELPAFDFSFEHFQRDTAKKHTHRINPVSLPSIRSLSQSVREQFGYVAAAEQAWSLYLP